MTATIELSDLPEYIEPGIVLSDLEALEDRILILPDEAQKVTKGGILLPDQSEEKPVRGRVLAVGPGKCNDRGERLPMPVESGDRVIYSKYGGVSLVLPDLPPIIVLRPTELICRVGRGGE